MMWLSQLSKQANPLFMWPKPVMSWFWKPWGLSKQLEGNVDLAIVGGRNLEIPLLLDNYVSQEIRQVLLGVCFSWLRLDLVS